MGIWNYFSRQARRPSGLFGRLFMARLFDKGNLALNERMKELVDPRNGDRILEIGFGSGAVVRDLAGRVGHGLVEGVDFSRAMLATAVKKNRRHIAEGRVRLFCGDFHDQVYAPESFTSVCSANTVYFWPDPRATLAGIHAALRPGGALVLAFVGAERMREMPLDASVFRAYAPPELAGLVREAGFSRVDVHGAGDAGSGFYCLKAFK